MATIEEKRIAAKRKLARQKMERQKQSALAQELGDVDAELEAREAIEGLSPKRGGFVEGFLSVPEVAASMVTELPARAAGGLAGAAASPFVGGEKAAELSEQVKQLLAFPVTTTEGKLLQEKIASLPILSNVGEFLQEADVGAQTLGGMATDVTGSPEFGAAVRAVGGALPEAASLVATRGAPVKGVVEQTRQLIPERVAQQADVAADIAQQADKFDIPVMTTDVFPPETWLGKLSQNLSAKLGVLGTGTARASQQTARNDAVKAFMDNAGIEIDSPFADQVVKSLNTKSTRVMNEWMTKRGLAKERLSEFGIVPLDNAIKAIDNQILKQQNLGAKGDKSIISDLEKYKSALVERDFSGVADIRSEVIKDLQKFSRGEDISRKTQIYQPVKSAIDKDLSIFSRKDPQAGKDWREANRNIANELDVNKNTELKRLLNSGEATPEIVMPIVRGGKPSQLKRLYSSLGAKGRNAVKNLIIQDALQQAKFFDLDDVGSPDALATRLSDPSRQKAIKVFFDGAEPPELAGLNELVSVLNKTRLAQQSPSFVRTGDQWPAAATLLGTLGLGAVNAPLAIGGTALSSALLKSYESKTFRNLLSKIGQSKNKPAQKSELLELAVPFALVGLQAGTEEQEPIVKGNISLPDNSTVRKTAPSAAAITETEEATEK